MTRRSRRNHSPAVQAKVAPVALKSEETPAELAERFDVHPSQIAHWRSQLLEGATEVFSSGNAPEQDGPSLKELHAKIEQLQRRSLGALTTRGRQGHHMKRVLGRRR